MDYVRLGSSGLKVSRLCLGTMTYGTPKWRPWVLDEAASRPFIKRAIEHGVNFFDTADVYSGRVLEVANRLGVKPTQIALAWMWSKPVITAPVVGASQLSHLDEAVEALNVKLPPDAVAFVEEPYAPHSVLGFDPTPSR